MRGSIPDDPIATLVCPFLQALPKVSLMITAISKSNSALIFLLIVFAVLLGSTGKSSAYPLSIFDLSIPAFAHINPCLVLAITVSPRFLKIWVDSSFNTSLISVTFKSTARSSIFEIIFWVTITTSPLSKVSELFLRVVVKISIRSSFFLNSGRP